MTNAISKETKHLPFFISRLKAWYELFYWNSQYCLMAVEIWAPSPPAPFRSLFGKILSVLIKEDLILREPTTEMGRMNKPHLSTPSALL